MTEDIYTKAETRRLGFIAVAKETLGLFGGVDKIMTLAREIEDFVVRPATEIGTASVTLRPRITEPASLNLLMGVADEYRAKRGAPAESWAEMRGSNGGGWTDSSEIRVRHLTGVRFVLVQAPVEYEYFRSKGSPNLVYRIPTYAKTTERAEYNSTAGQYYRWSRSHTVEASHVRDPGAFDRIPDPT